MAPVATKKKPDAVSPNMAAALDSARRVAAESRQRWEAFEELLRADIAGQTVLEIHALAASLGMTAADLASQRGRVESVMAWEVKAGTATERDAARAALDTAIQQSKARGDELREAIARAQAELATLHARVAECEAAVHHRQQAVESLLRPNMHMPHVLAEVNAATAAVYSSPENRELVAAKARLEAIPQILALTTTDAIRQHCEAVHLSSPELGLIESTRRALPKHRPEDPEAFELKSTVSEEGWRAYRAGLELELADLPAKVARLEAIVAEDMTQARRPLSRYLH